MSASQLTRLYAALWSTSLDVTPPCLPFPFSRVSQGNALERQSSRAHCAPLASHLMPRCAYRPLLQRHLRNLRVLRIHRQRHRLCRLPVKHVHSHMSLSWRGQKGRTLWHLRHYRTSCGKRQRIMQGFLLLHCLGLLISGVSIKSSVLKTPFIVTSWFLANQAVVCHHCVFIRLLDMLVPL